MILNDAVDGAQAEAGAFADGLGRVERIENALRIRGCRGRYRRIAGQLRCLSDGQ